MSFTLPKSALRKRRMLRARFETLEPRRLLAGDLVAHWQAEDLSHTVADGDSITQWVDSVQGVAASGHGAPRLIHDGLGGRSIVRFDASDGDDWLQVTKDESPMAGASDFSIIVAFVTSSTDLQGDTGDWFQNTGLVDANSLGLTEDWGVSINQFGQIAAGLGGGLGQTPQTVYSSDDALNDGQLHVAAFTRSGGNLSLYVDAGDADVRNDGSALNRSERLAIRFGMLQTGGNPFDGDIAEIRFYDGTLSPDEVRTIGDQIHAFYGNEPPVAVDDVYETPEDSLLFVPLPTGVTANDTDAEQDALTVALVDDVEHGELTLREDGSFLYVPDRDFFGVDSFSYTANDLQVSNEATVVIQVTPAYDAAVGVDDEYMLRPVDALFVDGEHGVLANDTNLDAVELSAILDSDVNFGRLTFAADGSFEYDPEGLAGKASFTYRIDDGTNISSPATVSIIVNTPPIAVTDAYDVAEDTPLRTTPESGVLANDVDADRDTVTAILVQTTENGSLDLNEDGSFVYTPNEEFSGTDLFSYQANDGVDESSATLVILNVTPVNDPPTAVADTVFALPNQLLEVTASEGVLANDTDVDSETLSAILVEPPNHGTLSFDADGSFTYIGNAGFVGVDSFTYRASDSQASSAETTVSIVVNAIDSLRQVVINEVHYDPVSSAEALEFIELFNRGSSPIDLSGWSISDGVDYTFPAGSTIDAQGYRVIAQDPNAAQTRFEVAAVGPWQGRLDNDGETIELRSQSGALIDEVTYKLGFPWPTVGDEPEHSMQLINAELDNDLGGSWRSAEPTPNEANFVVVENAPPHMRQVNHEPQSPSSNQPVTVTIKVTDDDGVANSFLEYQTVEPGSYIRRTDDEYQTNWTSIPMRDDGIEGDATANDDIYSVILPAELQQHRRLIRYRITAIDTLGNSIRGPYEDDPSPNFAYFVYDGIPDWTGADRPGQTPPVTYGADVMNSLPAYHLIANESDVENSQYNSRFNNRRFTGALFYDGVVYDHMEFKNRGQNSTYVTGKNKWKLFFNRGHEFQIRDDYGNRWGAPVRKLNLGTAASPWARPNRGLAGMDEGLAFKFFNLAGVPAPNVSTFQFRVVDSPLETDPESQYQGDLWGLYLAFEDPGGRYLKEHDLPDGNLFRMQGGSGDLRHQGLGLPGDRSDLRSFISTRTGYAKRNPVQPLEWWRDNVDLESYYSYRAVIEALNHSDLRDKENSLQFFNPNSGKWTQLPWDLDLLYEEFDRWGPDGVQNASTLEQFRLSLQHDEINIEFQARLREIQDLLFNSDQAWQAVEEYARNVEPFAAIDRAMWDYHPRTSSIHRGFFYRSPAPYHGGAAGLVRRELTSPDFEGMVNWVKEFIVDGGFGGDQLRALHTDERIPATPALTSLSDLDFPITNLRFQTSPFRDPQGDSTFRAMQWRIGEITDVNAPAYDAELPIHYEVTPVWTSGTLDTFTDTISIDASSLRVGHAYRARVRMQDDTGRWSHWSAPLEFTPTAGSSGITNGLRISEVHYHPADPSEEENAAGFTNGNDFEFVELVNVGSETIKLAGAQLTFVVVDGNEEGVSFDFADGTTATLAPGERTVVVEDLAAFQRRYGEHLSVAGEWQGRLSNAGETITLAAFGEPFLQFRYDDAWYPTTDGSGPSLEFIDPNLDELNAWSNKDNWRASNQVGGTPGLASSIPGDANRDGTFNSQDLVQVFAAGQFEDDISGNSDWEQGDWDGDGDFTTSDLVVAFQFGGYVALAGAEVPSFAIGISGVSLCRNTDRLDDVRESDTALGGRLEDELIDLDAPMP